MAKKSRTTVEETEAMEQHSCFDDDIASSITPLPSPSNSNETAPLQSEPAKTQSEPPPPQSETAEPKQQTELLEKYLKHQETMQVQAKTVPALREKHMAPSKKKQMLGLMKEKGLYKKFPIKRFKKFETWL